MHTIPRYRLQVVREESSPLYGTSPLTQSRDLYAMVRQHLEDLDHEDMIAVDLDAKYQPIAWRIISSGSLSMSIVHPREVYKGALLHNAAALIIAHNHPSGDPAPSREDRELTTRLVAGGKLLGIAMLDHIIVGDSRYYSFADDGLL